LADPGLSQSRGLGCWRTSAVACAACKLLVLLASNDDIFIKVVFLGSFHQWLPWSRKTAQLLRMIRLQRDTRICLLVLLITSQASIVSANPRPNSALARSVPGVWETVPSPTTNTLWSLDFSSSSSGWAGGDNVLLRYDGAAWQAFSVPALGTNYAIYSISMLSDTDGWLVGSAVKSQPYPESVVFRWDGAQWNEIASPTHFDLWTVSAADTSHVFTAGGGTLCVPACNDLLGWAYLWNGSSWISTGVGSHRNVEDVDLFGNVDGWMVGQEVDPATSQYQSLIMRWVDDTWQRVTTPAMNSNWLHAVSVLDTHHAWAVGGFAMLMWDGSAWSQLPFSWPSTPHALNDVQGISAQDAWAVGEMGTILHWDGSTLAVSSSPATVNLNQVANSSPSDIWAVGMDGTILHYQQAPHLIYLPLVIR
jgi:hypothetical protein